MKDNIENCRANLRSSQLKKKDLDNECVKVKENISELKKDQSNLEQSIQEYNLKLLEISEEQARKSRLEATQSAINEKKPSFL